MSGDGLVKLRALPMEEALLRAGLTGDCLTLVQSETDTGMALSRLEQAGFVSEAAKLLSYALPRREAVWWACMCAHYTAPADLPAADRAAIAAAEQWGRKETDEIRREGCDLAQRAGFGTPEAWAAVAAFWSGDSMSPLGQPKTPPAAHLTGTAAIGSITLAAVRTLPVRRARRCT